jgi:hypothetical protein
MEVNEDQPSMAKKVLGDSFAGTAMKMMQAQMARQVEAQTRPQNLGAAVEKASQPAEKKK